MKLLHSLSIVVVSMMFLVAGCAESGENNAGNMDNDTTMTEGQMGQDQMDNMQNNSVTATLNPTEGNEVEGTVTFTNTSNGVRVEGDLSGLSAGKHGFHIHENGDCSAPDASSAGGHFNPNNNDHGARTDSVRHMGDLGNIEAGSEGNATFSFTDSVLVMDKIMGRAVVVHGGQDDFTSQPSGAAGSRMACGVIESSGMQSDTTMSNSASMENENM